MSAWKFFNKILCWNVSPLFNYFWWDIFIWKEELSLINIKLETWCIGNKREWIILPVLLSYCYYWFFLYFTKIILNISPFSNDVPSHRSYDWLVRGLFSFLPPFPSLDRNRETIPYTLTSLDLINSLEKMSILFLWSVRHYFKASRILRPLKLHSYACCLILMFLYIILCSILFTVEIFLTDFEIHHRLLLRYHHEVVKQY